MSEVQCLHLIAYELISATTPSADSKVIKTLVLVVVLSKFGLALVLAAEYMQVITLLLFGIEFSEFVLASAKEARDQ